MRVGVRLPDEGETRKGEQVGVRLRGVRAGEDARTEKVEIADFDRSMRTSITIVAAAVTLASMTDCQFPRTTPQGTPQVRDAPDVEAGESLEATILFPGGSSDLDGAAMRTLDALSVALSRARADSVSIEGLANEHHHLQTNLDLGERRAQAVARYLASRGVGRTRYVTIGRESSADDPLGRACIIEPR